MRTWRFVARVDDTQIVKTLAGLLRKREAGELSAGGGNGFGPPSSSTKEEDEPGTSA